MIAFHQNVANCQNTLTVLTQRDPLSPYIFLLCVEILGRHIRKNKNIKAISINNKEYRISQYADDTDFILDGSSISFEETIDTLNIFAELSGLNINYDSSSSSAFPKPCSDVQSCSHQEICCPSKGRRRSPKFLV